MNMFITFICKKGRPQNTVKTQFVSHKLHAYTDGPKGLIFLMCAGEAMATHSSTLAWKIPWTGEPGRLQSMGSLRVGHD